MFSLPTSLFEWNSVCKQDKKEKKKCSDSFLALNDVPVTQCSINLTYTIQ